MFLGLHFRGSLWFFQLPGTNLGHIVEAPAGFGADGRLAATYLLKPCNEMTLILLIKMLESKIGLQLSIIFPYKSIH